jgi:hypothetical protein
MALDDDDCIYLPLLLAVLYLSIVKEVNAVESADAASGARDRQADDLFVFWWVAT